LERAVGVLMGVAGVSALTEIEQRSGTAVNIKCYECASLASQLDQSRQARAELEQRLAAAERMCGDLDAKWKQALYKSGAKK
jgi:hypothetical protein